MTDDLKLQLADATAAILDSTSLKKLIIAGPGAGKTFAFRGLLEKSEGPATGALVLTFINNLKDDLDRELGGLSTVYTFHGFCRRLLHSRFSFRAGLSAAFDYYPLLPSLIKADWEITWGGTAPQFVGMMRRLESNDETGFYLDRASYYDAVSFDDSVYRVHDHLLQTPADIPQYRIVLVDEYQDFNEMEASFIDLLGTKTPIVIAGDDDQALYVQLRGSKPEFIRTLHGSDEFINFELPFSMRCTEPVVNAVHDVLTAATGMGLLAGRIPKRYEYYPPRKAIDTAKYPAIKVVRTSVQSKANNYFGKYIAEQVKLIPEDEIKDSHEGHFPTVLVIGPRQYLRQIQEYLEDQGWACGPSQSTENTDEERDRALRQIHRRPDGNLGWRVLIDIDQPSFGPSVIRRSVADARPLVDLLPEDFRDERIAEAEKLGDADESTQAANATGSTDVSVPAILLTSFEGAKGLSAQHVFIVGLHDGDLPRNQSDIQDLEVCKYLVALTRTRQQCYLLYTSRWGAGPKKRSLFVSWVENKADNLYVNKDYWSNDG